MSAWSDPRTLPLRLVAAGSAVTYALVALDMAVDPLLGGELTALANGLGLPGTIDAGRGTLWHGLAVGQMVALAALARRLAANPAEEGTLHAITAVKLSSALTFAISALTVPALLLCALIDTFNLGILWGAVLLGRASVRQDLLLRYLRHMGADDHGLEGSIALLPKHMQPLFGLARLGLSWLGPLLLLGVPRAVGGLDPARFERLLERLTHHRVPEVRLVWLLLRTPLFANVARGGVVHD